MTGSATRYPTEAEVVALNDRLLLWMESRHGQLIDPNKLSSALARPQQAAYFVQADLIEQAAYLVEGIAQAHAFFDGNKRTAWMTGRMFLRWNGLRFRLLSTDAPDEDGRQVEALVLPNRPPTSQDDFVQWLRQRVS